MKYMVAFLLDVALSSPDADLADRAFALADKISAEPEAEAAPEAAPEEAPKGRPEFGPGSWGWERMMCQ